MIYLSAEQALSTQFLDFPWTRDRVKLLQSLYFFSPDVPSSTTPTHGHFVLSPVSLSSKDQYGGPSKSIGKIGDWLGLNDMRDFSFLALESRRSLEWVSSRRRLLDRYLRHYSNGPTSLCEIRSAPDFFPFLKWEICVNLKCNFRPTALLFVRGRTKRGWLGLKVLVRILWIPTSLVQACMKLQWMPRRWSKHHFVYFVRERHSVKIRIFCRSSRQ